MSVTIDLEAGVVQFACDTCGVGATVSVKLENGLDWRLKDATKAFCSFDCEMEHAVKTQERTAA